MNTKVSREIKFRGWHPGLKKMFSPEEMGIDQLTIMPDGQGFINVSGRDIRFSQLVPMIPMQYTGLKDKNGKEIYEGDVISYRTYWKTRHKTSSKLMDVIFAEGRFQLRFLSNQNPAGDMMSVSQCGEVIGNVYEQPNLLSQ